MKVSVFKNFNKIELNADLSSILDQIRTGKFKEKILELRELVRNDKIVEYNDKKRSLPAFTPSGIFEGGRKLDLLKEYSGCIVLDLDKLTPEQLIAAKSKIISIPYTYSCFISPGGLGLKILVKVMSRPVYHKQVFEEVKNYYRNQLDLPIDPSGKDITRLCFVSWDPELFLNPSSTLFQTKIYRVEEDVEYIVGKIEKSGIDLTDGYTHWLNIGFALVDALGEEGRSYFHRISVFYPCYDRDACDAQFDKCIHSKRSGVTIATLFHHAKEHGIDISGLRSIRENAKKLSHTYKDKMDLLSVEEPVPPGSKGRKRKNNITVIEEYLGNHYNIRYNIVTAKLEIRKLTPHEPEREPVSSPESVCPSGEPAISNDGFNTSFSPITDYMENSILRELLKNNIKCNSALLNNILYSDYSGFYDPFREYFSQLPAWDGTTDYILQLADTVATTSQVPASLFLGTQILSPFFLETHILSPLFPNCLF